MAWSDCRTWPRLTSSSFLARLFWAGVALTSFAPSVALIVINFMAALSTWVIDGDFLLPFLSVVRCFLFMVKMSFL